MLATFWENPIDDFTRPNSILWGLMEAYTIYFFICLAIVGIFVLLGLLLWRCLNVWWPVKEDVERQQEAVAGRNGERALLLADSKSTRKTLFLIWLD